MSSQEQQVRSTDDLDVIVDADAHSWESVSDIVPYIDDEYQGIVDLYLDRPDADSVFTFNASTPHSYPERLYRGEEIDGTYSLENKINELNDFGIEYSYMVPTLPLAINTINNDRVAVAVANGYNNWMIEEFLPNDRIKSSVTVAPQKPELAAAEINRLADENNMVAVNMPMTASPYGHGHEFYNPIYEAAEENQLPITFHPVNSGMTTGLPTLYSKCQTWAEQHLFGHILSNMIGLGQMMFRGLPERFPDLEFVIQEAGLTWAINMKFRMDDHYMEHAEHIPYLKKSPSEYLDDQFYFTTQPLGLTERPEYLAWVVEMVGPENVMYSADLPHVDFDPPAELFDRIRSHFDAETLNNIMGGTAIDVFNIE